MTEVTTFELPNEDSDLLRKVALLEDALKKRSDEVARYKKAYEALVLAYEKLRKQIFGRKSEKLTVEQIAFAWAEALKVVNLQGIDPADLPVPTPDDAENKPKPKPKHTPHARRNLEEADHLPTETIVIEPPELPEGAAKIGEDVSWKLEHQRARVLRLKIVRPIYAVPGPVDATETTVVQAHPVDEMIPKGLLAPGLLAHLIVSKWDDHLPYHRQERILARDGIEISRAVMCSSEKRCAELAKGILDAAREDAVKSAHIIGTDATGTLVQASGECRRGHFFVSIVDDDYIFFDYTPRHTQEAVKNLFEGFSGYLQADASSVYDSLFAAEKGPTEVGCLAHARRKFHEAVREDKSTAMTALAFFEGIFRIEREAKGLAPSQRLELRKARIAPLWKELLAWAEKQDAERARDRSLIGRAVRYWRSHREALGRFLVDGRIKLTNNACENALRKVVVGRHNWVFVGSDEDAASSCVWISLLASCRLHRVDPVAYLRDLFRILPMWPSHRLLELHPRFWSWTRARLDAAELDARYSAIRIPERVTLPRTSKLDEQPTA